EVEVEVEVAFEVVVAALNHINAAISTTTLNARPFSTTDYHSIASKNTFAASPFRRPRTRNVARSDRSQCVLPTHRKLTIHLRSDANHPRK
ncbi:MAG TPA: hypothetical protein VGL13_18365, partial [Polyangiaceae bacterium]